MTAMTLPHPEAHPDLYADVTFKRLLAWCVDVLIIALLTLVFSAFTLFTALLILPVFFATISFFYRWITIARSSATPGMRLMAIELRDQEGRALDTGAAFMHTAGYFLSVAIFPLQLVSIAMMILTEYRQGLTDAVIGTAMLNRRAL